MKISESDRALCYFRNLVYTTYREARHLGQRGRHPEYVAHEPKCKLAKEREKSHNLFRRLHHQVQGETAVERIVRPFRETTGLDLPDLPIIFGPTAEWHPSYGGKKWRQIAQQTLELGEAINRKDWQLANELCDQARTLSHNTGPLVDPSKPYKWPVDCDGRVGYMNS